MVTSRWIRKNQNPVFDPQQCPYCGSFSCSRAIAVCKMCGSPQCMGNGLGCGQCSICYVGLLPGWSGSDGGRCAYVRCQGEPVARGRGRKLICKAHAEHQGVGKPDYTGWILHVEA